MQNLYNKQLNLKLLKNIYDGKTFKESLTEFYLSLFTTYDKLKNSINILEFYLILPNN